MQEGRFVLKSPFKPQGDQPQAIEKLTQGLNMGLSDQVLLGVTGSGKTFNYVTPNICQLNTSYFITDPKGTLLKDAGFLFTDNGYKVKSFNTINLDESMHYNPLKLSLIHI